MYSRVATPDTILSGIASEGNEKLPESGCPAGGGGMVGRQVPEGSQPSGELAQAEQYRRPADRLLVPGRKVDDLAVPGDEVAEQRDRRALPFLLEEVAQVEQRLGPADLPEVDQPGVAAVVLEDRAGVEVAVRQPGAAPSSRRRSLPTSSQSRSSSEAGNSAASGPGQGSGR